MDWEALAASLDPARRHAAAAPRVRALAGGDINRACLLEFDSQRYFVKHNRAGLEAMFVAERRGLETILRSGA